MKTRLLILTAICLATGLFFVCPSTATASNGLVTFDKKINNSFSFFRTHRQGKGVTATWGMQAAGNVVEFKIERTDQDPFDEYSVWETLDVIPCNGARSYTYNDNSCYPGVINYRITAKMMDGSTITSEISSARIVSKH
jgi:hypothetical protein